MGLSRVSQGFSRTNQERAARQRALLMDSSSPRGSDSPIPEAQLLPSPNVTAVSLPENHAAASRVGSLLGVPDREACTVERG